MPNPTTRILVVEDEAAVRHYFLRVLSRSIPNLELIEAEDGLQAWHVFQSMPIDLILSDQCMPRLTGVELLQLVRAESTIPFLLISADRSSECGALAAGATTVLSKPISLSDLRTAISNALQISPLSLPNSSRHEGAVTLEHQPGRLPQFC